MPAKLDISKSCPKFPVLYDVEQSVGYNCVNHHDDVLLVQYLVKRCLDVADLRPLGHLALDGIFGPITHYWLLFFQIKTQRFYEKHQRSLEMPERGNVTSLRYPLLAGIPPERTMIGQLNGQCHYFHPAKFDHLEKDHHMPARLRSKLAHAKLIPFNAARP